MILIDLLVKTNKAFILDEKGGLRYESNLKNRKISMDLNLCQGRKIWRK